jgi:hypothetical protein
MGVLKHLNRRAFPQVVRPLRKHSGYAGLDLDEHVEPVPRLDYPIHSVHAVAGPACPPGWPRAGLSHARKP